MDPVFNMHILAHNSCVDASGTSLSCINGNSDDAMQ